VKTSLNGLKLVLQKNITYSLKCFSERHTGRLVCSTISVSLIPLPPSPGEEGGKLMIFQGLAPLPWERGWGEAKDAKLMNYWASGTFFNK